MNKIHASLIAILFVSSQQLTIGTFAKGLLRSLVRRATTAGAHRGGGPGRCGVRSWGCCTRRDRTRRLTYLTSDGGLTYDW